MLRTGFPCYILTILPEYRPGWINVVTLYRHGVHERGTRPSDQVPLTLSSFQNARIILLLTFLDNQS